MLSSVFNLAIIAFLYGGIRIDAFAVRTPKSRATLAHSASSANDLFMSDGWKPIQDDLDRVPDLYVRQSGWKSACLYH
jgi:hypothetical protein